MKELEYPLDEIFKEGRDLSVKGTPLDKGDYNDCDKCYNIHNVQLTTVAS